MSIFGYYRYFNINNYFKNIDSNIYFCYFNYTVNELLEKMLKYAKDNRRKVPLATSITEDAVEILDEICLKKGWTRPQAHRNLLEGVIKLLVQSGQINGNWISLEDLELCALSDTFSSERSKGK